MREDGKEIAISSSGISGKGRKSWIGRVTDSSKKLNFLFFEPGS